MIRSFFKLIRWINLIIIALSMYFIRSFVILPGLRLNINGGMNTFDFVLLVVATLSIAVGGYLINDLADKEIDDLNKPGINQVDVAFSTKTVTLFYWIFTLIGVVTGSWLSVNTGRSNYSFIFILTAGLLWFYAKRYKCQPITGNVVVAFLSALSFGLVWLFEFTVVVKTMVHIPAFKDHFLFTNKIVLLYMGFAFLVSLVRELIKDIEDYRGDDRFGCRTFAVVYGTGASKKAALLVLFFGLIFSGYAQFIFYQSGLNTLFYYFFVLDILFFINIIRLYKAEDKSQYSMLSAHLKILMAAGILSMILCMIDLQHVI